MHKVGTQRLLHFQQAQGPMSFHTCQITIWVQVRKESTTVNLGGVVANKNKGKEEEGSQGDERFGQRETEAQVGSPCSGFFAEASWLPSI